MNLRQTSLQSRQKFVSLCLVLFPEYRSIKINKNGKVTFWKKGFSFFNGRVRSSIDTLLYHAIPLKLSFVKWNSNDLYEKEYVKSIKDIFSIFTLDYRLNIRTSLKTDELDFYNDWLQSELENSIIMDISNPFLPSYRVHFVEESEMDITKKRFKVSKIKIKQDIIDPTLSRVQTLYFNLSQVTTKKYMTRLAMAIILSAYLTLGTWFKSTTEQILSLEENIYPDITFVPTLTYNPISYINKSNYFGLVQKLKSYSYKNYHDSS